MDVLRPNRYLIKDFFRRQQRCTEIIWIHAVQICVRGWACCVVLFRCILGGFWYPRRLSLLVFFYLSKCDLLNVSILQFCDQEINCKFLLQTRESLRFYTIIFIALQLIFQCLEISLTWILIKATV